MWRIDLVGKGTENTKIRLYEMKTQLLLIKDLVEKLSDLSSPVVTLIRRKVQWLNELKRRPNWVTYRDTEIPMFKFKTN